MLYRRQLRHVRSLRPVLMFPLGLDRFREALGAWSRTICSGSSSMRMFDLATPNVEIQNQQENRAKRGNVDQCFPRLPPHLHGLMYLILCSLRINEEKLKFRDGR